MEIKLSNYGWSSKEPEHSHSYLLPASIRLLKSFKVKSVLDIGTGNGSTLPLWLNCGWKVSAMEPDQVGFRYAKQHERADVRQLGVGDALPFDWHHAFDAVISLEVIEHLYNPSDLAQTAHQALKTGGIAVVSTPYHGYFKNLALAALNKWDFHHHPLRVGGHIKFYSKSTLTSLFIAQGFEECAFKGVGRFPVFWKSMIMAFRKK